jgi:predicted regulator of amino acid metabolism with ACT domain
MWEKIKANFQNRPSQMKIVRKMIELGLRVDDDMSVYCGDLKITDVYLAKTVDVDRRIVKFTIKTILNNEYLSGIFKNIVPAGTLLKNIAKNLSLGVVEIETDQDNYGILAEASRILFLRKINIRQAYANDKDMDGFPILTIITEAPVPGDIVNELLSIKGITKVSIY